MNQRKNKLIISALCVSLAAAALFAADVKEKSVKIPGGNKVVIVGRISFKTPIDIEGRRKGLYITEEVTPSTYSMGESLKPVWEFEEPFYYTAKIGDDGTVTLDYARCRIFGVYQYFFDVPLLVKIVIPDGAQFVYIGNFEYDLDYALRVKGFQHYDEYEKAKKWINRAVGKDVTLVRGELNFIKAEDSKKK